MQVRIHKRTANDVAMLVDWQYLEPFWLRSTFAPLDRGKLVHAYSERWFDRKLSPWKFTLGEIFFCCNKHGLWEIQFCNGRNRTNLLIKHQNLVPVCILDEIPNDADIKAALVKPLNEGDIVSIPSLPIYSVGELKKLQPSGGMP